MNAILARTVRGRYCNPASFSYVNIRAFYSTPATMSSPPTPGATSALANSNGISLTTRHVASPSTLAISEEQDDPDIRSKYRQFLLPSDHGVDDWVADLELDAVTAMVRDDIEKQGSRLKVLVLYGSLRKRLAQSFIYFIRSRD